jgi:outer membrane protein TolC
MKNSILLITFFAICSANVVSAQEKSTFSLAEAKQYALENNPNILNASLETDISLQKKREVFGMGLPQVSFSGAFNNFINLPVQVVGANFINPNAAPGETISFKAGTDYSANGTLQANQLLFNGSYIVGLQVAKLFVDFQKTLETQTQEDVVFNVIQAYQVASVAKENILFSDSMMVITKELVEKQKNYLDLGMMKQDDYDQLSFSMLTAQNALMDAQNQYQNALTLLKMTMGYPIEQNIEIVDKAASLMLRSNLGSSSLDDNINVKVLEQQRLLNAYNMKNLQSGKLPTLNAYFQQQYNAFRNDFDFFANKKWYPQTVWGLQLNVPIYSGGQKNAQIQQAQIKLKQNDNSIGLLKESLKFQEAQARLNLSNASQKLELQQANIDLAQRIYKNSLIKKEIGQESSINVTQKYNQLIIAQAQYAGAQVAVLNAKLELEKLYNQILRTNN